MPTRASILRGPAIITFNGATFYSKGDIKVNHELETFDIESSAYGKVDERAKERIAKISFTPVGEWESLAVLSPYGATVLGTSIFTGSDLPLVIKTLDGKTLTYSAAALTKVPDIILSATKTRFGECEFTCIGTDNTAWTGTNSLLTIGAAAFSDTTFDPANVVTEPVVAAWGSAPWDNFKTADGFVISQELQTSPIEIDDNGIIDIVFGGLKVMAKCRPLGITEADLLTAMKVQGAGNARGRSLQAGSNDLVLTPTTGVVTIKGAAMKSSGYEFGAVTLRIGEVGFVATRTLSIGVVQPLITIS